MMGDVVCVKGILNYGDSGVSDWIGLEWMLCGWGKVGFGDYWGSGWIRY